MSLPPQAPPFSIGDDSALKWWLEQRQQHAYPDLSRLAIDIFSIPPMSAEAERVFSGARRTISWERAKLGESKAVSSYDRAFRVFEELADEQAITWRILKAGR